MSYLNSYSNGLVVGLISDLEIQLGTEYSVINNNTETSLSLVSLSTDSFYFAYSGSDPMTYTGYGFLLKFSVSQTDITLDGTNIFTSMETPNAISLKKVSEEKFIIFYNNSSNYLVCKVYDAGQDLLGEATNLTSINTYPFDIVELGDGKVLINYIYSSQSVINDTSNILYHLIVIESNLSVNTFTFETDCGIYLNTIQFGNTNVYSQSSLIDTNKVFIIVTTNNAPYGFVADFSSDDLISYPLSQVGSNISVFSSVSVLKNKLILNYTSSQQNVYSSSFPIPENNPELFFVSGKIIDNQFYNSTMKYTFNLYLGISQDTVSKGQKTKVLLSGVDSNQSDLEINKIYVLTEDGELVIFDNNAPKKTFPIGKSLSENKLNIFNLPFGF